MLDAEGQRRGRTLSGAKCLSSRGHAFVKASQPPASLDGQNGEGSLQLLHGFDDGLPRRRVFVGLLTKLVQNSVCLGDVLDRLCVFATLSGRFFCSHICLLCPVGLLDECRFYPGRAWHARQAVDTAR